MWRLIYRLFRLPFVLLYCVVSGQCDFSDDDDSDNNSRQNPDSAQQGQIRSAQRAQVDSAAFLEYEHATNFWRQPPLMTPMGYLPNAAPYGVPVAEVSSQPPSVKDVSASSTETQPLIAHGGGVHNNSMPLVTSTPSGCNRFGTTQYLTYPHKTRFWMNMDSVCDFYHGSPLFYIFQTFEYIQRYSPRFYGLHPGPKLRANKSSWWVIATAIEKVPVFAIRMTHTEGSSKYYELYRVISPEQQKAAMFSDPSSVVDVSTELELVSKVEKCFGHITINRFSNGREIETITFANVNIREFTMRELQQTRTRNLGSQQQSKQRLVCEGFMRNGKRLVCVNPNQDNLLLFAVLFIFNSPLAFT